MELVPRLTVRDDDALLVTKAEYRVGDRFSGKYAAGLWPCGEYAESSTDGAASKFASLFTGISRTCRSSRSRRRSRAAEKIVHKQLVSIVQ